MPSDPKALNAWLAKNTRQCERLGSMIEPSFCKRYRQTSAACMGCEQAEEMDRVAAELAAQQADAAAAEQTTESDDMAATNRKTEPEAKGKSKKPILPCADCGRSMPIVARGLCGKCYRLHSEAGTLDEKFPAKKRGRAQQAEPAEGAAGAVEDRALSLEEVERQGKEIDAELAEREAGMPNKDQKQAARPPRQSNKNHVAEVSLRFFERDVELLEELQQAAKKNRRGVSAEILCRLDRLAALEGAQDCLT